MISFPDLDIFNLAVIRLEKPSYKIEYKTHLIRLIFEHVGIITQELEEKRPYESIHRLLRDGRLSKSNFVYVSGIKPRNLDVLIEAERSIYGPRFSTKPKDFVMSYVYVYKGPLDERLTIFDMPYKVIPYVYPIGYEIRYPDSLASAALYVPDLYLERHFNSTLFKAALTSVIRYYDKLYEKRKIVRIKETIGSLEAADEQSTYFEAYTRVFSLEGNKTVPTDNYIYEAGGISKLYYLGLDGIAVRYLRGYKGRILHNVQIVNTNPNIVPYEVFMSMPELHGVGNIALVFKTLFDILTEGK